MCVGFHIIFIRCTVSKQYYRWKNHNTSKTFRYHYNLDLNLVSHKCHLTEGHRIITKENKTKRYTTEKNEKKYLWRLLSMK